VISGPGGSRSRFLDLGRPAGIALGVLGRPAGIALVTILGKVERVFVYAFTSCYFSLNIAFDFCKMHIVRQSKNILLETAVCRFFALQLVRFWTIFIRM
jgi:hypothetical protein